jgi:amino acid transporter/nitrogen-specific signal transduction histidine kinase/HAMP domain-containing protein
MLFLVGALLAGQTFDSSQGLLGVILQHLGVHIDPVSIPGQATAAIPLLIVGLLLGWMAVFGWTELIMMFPNRVGGIAATCGEAFQPYAPVLGNLTGICYWWGWVPTCGVTALLSASVINTWFFHLTDAQAAWALPFTASALICLFAAVNLCGVKWVTRMTIPIAIVSATLAFLSAVVPVFAGKVDWHQACSFHLATPFPGWFGKLTSAMAGLYLVGFAAPAFEAAACHVGETKNVERNVPRAMFAAATMATLYFLVLPVVWLGVIGSDAMAGDLSQTLGPTFAPLFGGLAKAAAAYFMMFNMFHGTIAPLTGVCRTLSQLADDGLLPEFFGIRMARTDAPIVATLVTAGCAILFLIIGDPIWLIAAANLTYLIGISLPNVAVWLLRRDQPDMHRPYRAPRGTIMLGLVAAVIWGISTLLGFQQFGLPTVIFGLVLAYSGAMLYAWRKWSDHRKSGRHGVPHSLHMKLTGAMLLVLIFDGTGYLMAVNSVGGTGTPLTTALQDIFVAVALLTITVGLVLPGTIAHSAVELAKAAERLAKGTLNDFSRAMEALAEGDLEAAYARLDLRPVIVHTRDEVGQMAESFNTMQAEVARAAIGLDGAREGLRRARNELTDINSSLEQRVIERTAEVEAAHKKLVDAAWYAGMAEVAVGVLHNVGNVLNSVNTSAAVLDSKVRKSKSAKLSEVTALLNQHNHDLANFVTTDPRGQKIPEYLRVLSEHMAGEQSEILAEITALKDNIEHINQIVATQQSLARPGNLTEELDVASLLDDAMRINFGATPPAQIQIERDYAPLGKIEADKHRILQILVNLISNARYALERSGREDQRLILRIAGDADRQTPMFTIQVSDNGIGIAADALPKLFTHGFTTKKSGHGFGLHSAAVAARDLGGSLIACSPGEGCGAVFTLRCPLIRPLVAA